MRTASVTELKANLSRYLRMVRRGSEIEILERGVPIARLVGLVNGTESANEEHLERLVHAGLLRRGIGGLDWLLEETPIRAPGAQVSEALDQDREDRR